MRLCSTYRIAVLVALLSTSAIFAVKPRHKFSFSLSPAGSEKVSSSTALGKDFNKVVGKDSLSTQTSFGIISESTWRVASHFDLGMMARMQFNVKPYLSGNNNFELSKEFWENEENKLRATVVDATILPKTHVKVTPALDLNMSCGLGLSVMGPRGHDSEVGFVVIPGVGLEYSLNVSDSDAVALSLDAHYSMASYNFHAIGDVDLNLFTVSAGIVYSL